MSSITTPKKASTRDRLLAAALMIVWQKGFTATSVDDLCRAADVTKGAFFHHFESKEALGVAAAVHWSEMTGRFFEDAPYHRHADPLDRVMGYLDFRKDILQGELWEFTCLVGTMAQEVHGSSPAIADACRASIVGHAAKIASDLAEAMKQRGVSEGWTATSLALHTQAVLQGGGHPRESQLRAGLGRRKHRASEALHHHAVRQAAKRGRTTTMTATHTPT
jgi:TetR/AcrR family transcriptional repressor of nem operon